jgi:transcriptional regulator with XRE-family HTH domain
MRMEAEDMARTRWPKGTWMKLRSAAILTAYMEDRDFSMARLARYADCSKSFISHLTSGRKNSCTPELAERIAEAFGVPTIALFEPQGSAVGGHGDKGQREKVPA